MEQIIKKTIDFVTEKLKDDSTGHDHWHCFRVYKTAMEIADKYSNIDRLVVALSALLHDIADWKFNDGDEKAGSKTARPFLAQFNLSKERIDKICYIIDNISFKGGFINQAKLPLEGQIAQDADRLDALGAIGIARTFAYGGKYDRELWNPEKPPTVFKSKEEYLNNESSSINHFFERMIFVREHMNTEIAKEIAFEREKFITGFLKQFFGEWYGDKNDSTFEDLYSYVLEEKTKIS